MDSTLLPRCLSLDLEVNKQNGRIRAFAAVRPGVDQPLIFDRGDFGAALAMLDEFAVTADFLLGHNLIDFDLPHLRAAKPDLAVLSLPAVDTLWLNPLAFPRNPYHHLVKHYQDGQLKRGRINDPELDARLVLEVFSNQNNEFRKASPELLVAWHYLTSMEPNGKGFEHVFTDIRGAERPNRATATDAIRNQLDGNACANQGQRVLNQKHSDGWSLAYALAWLSVSGGNSVMPPWVRHQFPQSGEYVRLLRDTPCGKSDCDWCAERHDPREELKRWFGFDEYRPDPKNDDGRPMQQVIIEEAMSRRHLLGILPTGTGKSLCYQLPALSRYDKTGALTVVISPLVALMEDQVSGLEAQGVGSCVAVNGLLSLPERKDALDRVRLGDAGILLISPEQLRSTAVRRVIDQREIGGWVLDEAHCLSKWGHDFRPDYRYVGRFIRERAGNQSIPPVMCLTATAKPDVVADINQHFKEELGIELEVFDGGTHRTNLEFTVIPTTGGEKFAHILHILTTYLPVETPGGAIIYCASRRQTEEIAEFLQDKEIRADFFHAGLPPDTKKDVQHRFIDGELRVVTATNAFGMGIDKSDVRLVIHADIPGSLENYLQEAGRAGRDRQLALCVLLYSPEDIERQFGMSARSRLTRQEIHGVLRSLRNLDRKKRLNGEVVATPGEILGEDDEKVFERDSTTDDTRVRTAVSWLEEAILLTREENRVQVFPSSLRVDSVDEAQSRLSKMNIAEDYRKRLLSIAETLIDADPDDGISTDELMGISGLSAEAVRGAMYDLERVGIASNDTALTAFVHSGVVRSSQKRFNEAAELETNLISLMREIAPDISVGERWPLHLRVASDLLRAKDVENPLPELIWRILRSIAFDGRGEGGDAGSLGVRRTNMDTVQVTLRRSWSDLEELASRRRNGAKSLLDSLLSGLPPGRQGTDLLVETTLGKLLAAITSDLFLESKKPEKLLDRALLWMHEQEVIRLHKGLAVFRPAMTIKLAEDRRGFAKVDFEPLDQHYKGQVRQIHVMAEFAQRGLEDIADALRLAMDYFSLKQEDFIKRWLPDREKETARETTPESWRAIVESLKNPIQQRIVADDHEQMNMLVLAGPGSGKTRVLVHRIAYLVRVRRENPRGILALAYNRHAAIDIRRRLKELIGDDARGITVLTCHALAMRIVGVSFRERERKTLDDAEFRKVLRQAVALLHGEGLEEEEADDQRDRLLAGFRWILVDEYQDIGEDQYELISALAGRTLEDEDRKLTLFAVGDDDQNIYTFNGASVEFIRRFEEDYGPKPMFLVENYRSTGHIITTANTIIDSARNRLKSQHPIRIDRARAKNPEGGKWGSLDPVSKGRVQILHARRDPISQAQVAIKELKRLESLSPDWNWSECAVIAREWKYLDPVRALSEVSGIPVHLGNEEIPSFWHLRETRMFTDQLRHREIRAVNNTDLYYCLETVPTGPWKDLMQSALDDFELESGVGEVPLDHFMEWLAEWGRDARRRQHGLLLLTAHRAKGLEFEHVVVLDGGWDKVGRDEDRDAPRRLFYVSMTRAKQTLATVRFQGPSSVGHPGQRNLVQEPESPVYTEDLRSLPFYFPNNGSILYRSQDGAQNPTRELARQYRRPSLREINLGFVGRFQPNHSVHRAISALSHGDPLTTRITEQGTWELLDQEGMVVGRLARTFEPPGGAACCSASVFAIVSWSREASDPNFREVMKCDTWEVVVPEFVFEPEPV
ncbi:MAG: RecQ family ATP-dependent DNA helicase [Gemmatimonadetes bacterium]|nr:RecQ family ATP-dependent DNA helicase [Gemmatimonadota bacterium]MYG86017.1 RecQ family ATP-dependent DNA helicase [Gemmatimonadota bacterium]MYJ89118.1 RecQ family ATP-dependent DNA helicase [Gemmatimonadota bacterium]